MQGFGTTHLQDWRGPDGKPYQQQQQLKPQPGAPKPQQSFSSAVMGGIAGVISTDIPNVVVSGVPPRPFLSTPKVTQVSGMGDIG